VLDGAKTNFETAWNTMTTQTTATLPESSAPPPEDDERIRTSAAYRTAFAFTPEQVGVSGSQAASIVRLTRCSMPVVASAADAAVKDADDKYVSSDLADAQPIQPASTGSRQLGLNAARHTIDWPMYVPLGSSEMSQSPQSKDPLSPASPAQMGAPPGTPSACDFEGWWTPNMVR
jgi:hypothetical protein